MWFIGACAVPDSAMNLCTECMFCTLDIAVASGLHPKRERRLWRTLAVSPHEQQMHAGRVRFGFEHRVVEAVWRTAHYPWSREAPVPISRMIGGACNGFSLMRNQLRIFTRNSRYCWTGAERLPSVACSRLG